MTEISNNKAAMDQLKFFFGRRATISVINAQLAQGV